MSRPVGPQGKQNGSGLVSALRAYATERQFWGAETGYKKPRHRFQAVAVASSRRLASGRGVDDRFGKAGFWKSLPEPPVLHPSRIRRDKPPRPGLLCLMIQTSPQRIELKLQSVHQLFNSMDPAPFHERDLDDDAEEFIVSWAREHPVRQPIRLIVHLGQTSGDADNAQLITDSIHHYFDYKATLNRREFRQLMTEGWVSLIIGLSFLALCTLLAQTIAPKFGHLASMAREGLTIMGWVAMWTPLDIDLYRWWPIFELGRVYRKLSQIPIEVSLP